MTEPLTLAVFGADGATGKQVVLQAAARGHRVRAIEPDWPDDPPLPEGVEARQADVLSEDLAPVMDGCDAVISAIGLPLSPQTVLTPPPLYTEGSVRMVDGLRATGCSRLIVISATFVETKSRGPHWFRAAAGLALERVFSQMAEMERILRAADDIDWTATRPGWLMDGDLTEDYVVTPEAIREDLIRTRHADLAHFMLHCAETGEWSRATPAIARPEASSESRPDALLRQVRDQIQGN